MSLHVEVAVLNKISHLVARRTSITEMLQEVLKILHVEMGLIRGTVTLREGDVLVIEASEGLSRSEIDRGLYRVGEGITGLVAAQGKGRIIPDISKEKGFLNRTKARDNQVGVAFVCVPIIYKDDVIGTLSIDRKVGPDTDLKADYHLLDTIANIMADAIFAAYSAHEEREKLESESRALKLELENKLRPTEIIGNCSNMKKVYSMISKVAASNATVLIRGESGTGKELVAKAIQKNSSRADKPFIAVNCAALPEGLIESELFGHEKGSFTGAINRKIGLAELANTGTLFLDEIGDLSQPMQLKLLRFIQEHTFYRVGGNEERKVDVRIIAATSRNLEEMIAKGDFREDLYYRLNVFPIYMPALRNRKSDIILLAEYFLKKYSQIHNKPILRISTPAINMMTTYHWPGNVRELENCIEYAVLNTSDNFISGYNLPPSLQTAEGTETSIISPSPENGNYESMVASFEKELIVEALKLKHGNASAAAKHLGATQRVILYKIKKLGIDPSLYK
ncbi:transcriptional regulator NifA subfamily Fis Family [Coraliomargarita sp. CAG:312]|nr:transcriptional regulator NifA subfamily Fis Family [Coraliomargarita sp. CAG:312]